MQAIINYSDWRNTYFVVNERKVSGDIVGDIQGDQFHVDQSDTWLFDWEKEDPNCYARRMQTLGTLELK